MPSQGPTFALHLILAVALCGIPNAPIRAQDTPKPAVAPTAPPRRFTSEHIGRFGGREVRFQAIAGETLLLDDEGAARASFFSFAYVEKDTDPRQRPVTFAFNGGPGSSSIWLHLGVLGPLRTAVPSDAEAAGSPPYPLVPNEDSLLAVSDVVLIDPVGTGFSTPRGKAKAEDFFGVDEDARSVAEFIRRWLTENRRWASPKYILGESYGGVRAPLVLRQLQDGSGACALNGLIFVSPAFDLEFVDGSGSDLHYALLLPTLAATAAYHHALPEAPTELESFLQEARGFASGEYLTALFLGNALDGAARTHVVSELRRFTGLASEYIERADLRISAARFRRELLRDRGQVLGRLDARYLGTEHDDAGEQPTRDPMSTAVGGAYVATFLDYIARELQVEMPVDYVVSSGKAGGAWKRSGPGSDAFSGWLDVVPQLERGLADNPELRVFVASGLYDTATTFFTAEYQANRRGMDPRRVTLRNYPAGHMMYLHQPSLARLAGDLRAFVTH